MFDKKNLGKLYFKYSEGGRLSPRLPDYTKNATLFYMERGVNCCEKWDSFLDLGCGDGHYSVPLLKIFKKGVGVEIDRNETLLTLANKYDNFSTIIGDFKNLAIKNKYDFILLADVIEHVPLDKIDDLCKKLAGIQEKGGIIYVLTPNPIYCGPASESDLFYDKNGNDYHGHYRHYYKNELINLFSNVGYHVVFMAHEESGYRQNIKKYIFAFSIRDKKYQKYIVYRFISPLFIYVVKFLIYLFSLICFLVEKNNRNNEFEMMSQIIVFKKYE